MRIYNKSLTPELEPPSKGALLPPAILEATRVIEAIEVYYDIDARLRGNEQCLIRLKLDQLQ